MGKGGRMIRDNTDCPYLHDIFDQYCNLFKGYKNCGKRDCEVLKILKENEQLRKMNNEQKETLKKVRVALIQERTANIMNYGKGGVEMFDNMFEILKGVTN